MAPPILGRHGPDGSPRKSRFGPWMMTGFKALAALRRLRGTALDVFSYTAERRMERALLTQYEEDVARIIQTMSARSIEAAAALASVPAMIRGYGHVKAANADKAAEERKRLIARFSAAERSVLEAAE
jgi:indolepyruvate ferredoxin oxidoreductase